MPKQQSAQPATVGTAEYSAEAIIGSACYCQCSRIHGRINNRLSLSLPIQQNTGLSRCTYTFHNASQRRGQEGKSARRGDGLRNYECFPFSQTCPCQSVLPERKIPIHSSLQQQKKCQLIRMPQHPYPTGRSSTVRKLRKEEPDHFLLQEVRSPVTPHYPSRVLAP